MTRFFALVLVFIAGLLPNFARADDMIVEKRVFELPEMTTVSGKVIKNVKIGWEAYGTLNADKSNVILVAHFFSGTSHAAGKYAASDRLPGYWDAIIGPGKAIDTNKYYVISSDTLVNLNVGDPRVTTTGPASIDPDTGKPYGMRFPLVTIGDFVKVQKALVESLGVTKLHAVMGPSMGGLQTYEWAASYPDMVERIMPVISAADPGPWLTAWLNVWAAPILVDPKWNNGDYYGKEAPLEGLKQALKIVSLQANDAPWAEKSFGDAWAEEGKDPLRAYDNRFKIEAALDAAAGARAALADANHFLYLVKANQTFVPGAGAGAKTAAEGLRRIKAKTLIIYSSDDRVFLAPWIQATAEAIRANGAPVDVAEVKGPMGHLNGVALMAPLTPKISEFLEK
ncbi:E22 family MetX-like putative esterase [Methylovirgula sp. 4M-Z18]|uniref:E22 family MetX-like putative esterase n=1 Tax=Methylovirgula sp. 4M-Z18 TaxID=2293567 RepID=UPI000E2F64BB|nr:homoserine O-acetyltransferase [Methylovirgula sp. 4M-Z18]RFB80563.1 homoserine O-acetyltransferase [Methylovirgula sp. 4M-Z18]